MARKTKTTSGRRKAPSGIKASTRKLPKPLPLSKCYKECSPARIKFADTSQYQETQDIISQDRAVRAINMGLGIRKPGYNIYVAGIQGTGKTSVIRTFLEQWSADAPTPCDWVYVHDFTDQEEPRAIKLPTSGGRKFRKCMENLIKSLREVIPNALQSEDFENAVNAYLGASNEKKSKLFAELEKKAKGLDFAIKSNRMGIETVPIVDGRVLTEKDYGKLSEADRDQVEEKRSQLEPEVLDFARKVRAIENETSEYVENLRNDLGLQVVGGQIDPIIEDYKDVDGVVEFLTEAKEHILENMLDFIEEESDEEGHHAPPEERRDPFRKYRVNVFVDNTQTKGAPVIIESNPTWYNLFGRIEKNVEHGMYLTDYTMIKAGAVHRANGGYLVLNAQDIFKTPSIWDTLKRVLKNRLGFIEDMGEQYSLLPTSGLRPVPIPLDLKVILIGSNEIYHMLFDMDEDFHKIFKIKADFDYKMPRDNTNVNLYAAFVATRAAKEDLLPFDKGGIAAVVEYGSRLVEDQRFLSTQFSEIKDLTIEADFIARENGLKMIDREAVESALNQKYLRLNLYEEQTLEMVQHEDILLTVDGERIGQVNGLAVYDFGDFSFGKIGRITCTTSISDHGILNIERASKLSGKIHDKGVLILSGFLNGVLSRDQDLGFSASVCFEQSYGMIDGDSATVAELVAIVSALANIPVAQNFAMTGSLNQFGEVQPVGGINEKIEGYFKTCELIGSGGEYNVIIPVQNVPNLMLTAAVRDAVEAGWFKIYPVRHAREAFELVTGVAFGIDNIHNDHPEEGSALGFIRQKLIDLQEQHDDKQHPEINEPKTTKAPAKRAQARRRIPL